jgi:hypothetical protein
MSWLINKKDIEWLKGLFGLKPKPQPVEEPIKEIIYTPYETVVVKAQIQETELQRYAVIDPNYTETQVKNQLALDIMEQLLAHNLMEFRSTIAFNGNKVVEAILLVSVKK